jgi:hypothetical protein
VVFDFRRGRGREDPKRFIGQFEGILHTDGYTESGRAGSCPAPPNPREAYACLCNATGTQTKSPGPAFDGGDFW